MPGIGPPRGGLVRPDFARRQRNQLLGLSAPTQRSRRPLAAIRRASVLAQGRRRRRRRWRPGVASRRGAAGT